MTGCGYIEALVLELSVDFFIGSDFVNFRFRDVTRKAPGRGRDLSSICLWCKWLLPWLSDSASA